MRSFHRLFSPSIGLVYATLNFGGNINLNRLDTAVTQQMEYFTYDPVGNRLTSDNNKSYAYGPANQLLTNNATSFSYDNNGNLIMKTTTEGTTTYAWDFENRLTMVTMPSGSTAAYRYDPFGRRIEKRVTENGITTTTRYLYDNEDILAEYDDTNTITNRYTHGPGIDEPLALTTAKESYYYHADGLGSIVAMTDASGKVVQTYEYDSFGNLKDLKNKIKQPYSYTGREYDRETGLYYYRARYYDAQVGRFVSKDPISFAGGDVNLYGYVGNNPINYTDPTGLRRCFNFDKFANQVEQNRASNALTLGSLITDLSIGTMPKTPGELRGFGPASKLNPYTSQLSRWSGRLGTRVLRELGRTTAGIAAGAIATGAVVFEGFYDWGVIGKAAWDATSSDNCDCQGR